MTIDRHIKAAVVTGGAGFIGRYLLVELTRQGAPVCTLVRGPGARLPELRAWVDAHGGNGALLSAADFDLEAPDLGLTPEGEAWLDRADAVYHLAARFEFGLSAEAARGANVDASVRLVERLARSPRLERLVYLSGYRTEGTPARALDVDDPAALRRFYRDHGAYEASKMEAHQRVARRADELGVPLTRVSPAVVIGHSQTGETMQFIGMVETLRLLHARRLPALPGNASTWLPLVPVDLVAAVLARVPRDPLSRGEHLLVFDERSPSLPALVEQAAAQMRVPAPRLCLPVWFVRALPTAFSGVDREGLSFISSDRYDPAPQRAFMARTQLAMPDIEPAFARWLDFLVAHGFGDPAGAEQGRRDGGRVGPLESTLARLTVRRTFRISSNNEMSHPPAARAPVEACCPPATPTPMLPADTAEQNIQLAQLAKALGHPARVSILRTLLQRDTCVAGELGDALPLAQSTVSQHLKQLKEAGLIRGEVSGPRICYCAEPGAVALLKALVTAL